MSLQETGFITVGAGMTYEQITKPLFWETTDGKLAIVNWVFPETHPDWLSVPGPNCWPGINEAKNLIRDLKKKVDWVLVLAHWSDELFSYPRPEDRDIAREMADAGADFIVSHHPHVVRGMEIIGNCHVFYSLGNYYFSDFENVSDGRITKWAPRNREGLGIQISFVHGFKPEYEMFSFWQGDRRVVMDPTSRAVRRLKSSSKPLARFSSKDYEQWYSSERDRFDKFWARWHFGIRRLGVWGLMQYMLRRIVRR